MVGCKHNICVRGLVFLMPGSIHRGHAGMDASVAFTYKDVWLKAAPVTLHKPSPGIIKTIRWNTLCAPYHPDRIFTNIHHPKPPPTHKKGTHLSGCPKQLSLYTLRDPCRALRKQSLLGVAAFAVCVYYRICLHVSKLPAANSV